MFISHSFSRLSVRARIVALGVIPVVGFLAYGMAYMISDIEVGHAFDSVHRDNAVVDASSDLKAGLLTMRVAATEFVAQPSEQEVKSFAAGQDLAMRSLDRIEATVTSSQQDIITPLRITVRDLKASFDSLVGAQQALGYSETDGITAQLVAASAGIEHIIQHDLSWVADQDSAKLQMSLLTMRRHELEYRLTRSPGAEQHFLDEVKHFDGLFDSVDGPPAAKQKLYNAVKAYNYTFSKWVASTDDIQPLVELIDHDTESVLPEADKIISAAQANADNATRAFDASRGRTRWVIVWLGLAFAMIGFVCSWLIGRSITLPLEKLAGVMNRLAGGDVSAPIPATDAGHEIGAMARTVIVFRDNMIERERLSGVQTEASAAREQRGEAIAAMIGKFRTSVESALARLRESAQSLDQASSGL
ncbi:MAG: HAMP domain-containing protein, partial [Xanthobacteraceae bacterium]